MTLARSSVCVWGDQENEFYESAIFVAYVFLRELENIISTRSIIWNEMNRNDHQAI